MPQFIIEAPLGIRDDAKQEMVREITEAIDEAFHIPDIRIWVHEYPADNVAQDGQIGAEPVKPLCFLEAPELHDIDARRVMTNRIDAAIAKAYDGLANTDETLILMNHYPLERAANAGRLHSDNPEMVEAMRQLNTARPHAIAGHDSHE
jgi:phenylpyruvate tautomerase PptA (4-oxalocrotonate tautomerase family)